MTPTKTEVAITGATNLIAINNDTASKSISHYRYLLSAGLLDAVDGDDGDGEAVVVYRVIKAVLEVAGRYFVDLIIRVNDGLVKSLRGGSLIVHLDACEVGCEAIIVQGKVDACEVGCNAIIVHCQVDACKAVAMQS